VTRHSSEPLGLALRRRVALVRDLTDTMYNPPPRRT